MNVLFIFRTFRSIFEFLATYETTFDPQKGQKNSKIERNVQKMNETFFLQTKKEHRERNVLLYVLNVNERRERIVLLKRTEKNVRTKHSFEKNGCPTLQKRGKKQYKNLK